MSNKKITGLAIGALLLALSYHAEGQQPTKISRVGYLNAGSASTNPARIEAFRQGLRELGYVEGKNIVIEYRYGEGKLDRVPALAAELVRLNVDIIVVAGGNATLSPIKQTTDTIPIVMANVADPVASGFIASLAWPGANITGLAALTFELAGKRLELVRETFPKVSRVAVLLDPQDASKIVELKETQAAA